MIRVAPLEPRWAPAWSALFQACASSCYCRYWHFAGNKNEWLARCALDGTLSRDEQLASLERGDPSARGLLALEQDVAVGWIKLAPRTSLPKLTGLSVYKSLVREPAFLSSPSGVGEREGAPLRAEDVYVVGCVLVRPERRRQGVARALVDAAERQVLAWGGRAIEAYPRHSEAPLHDEEVWMGPERLYADLGYAWIAGAIPYPVYRKILATGE